MFRLYDLKIYQNGFNNILYAVYTKRKEFVFT
jgi:hypothetical protein